VRLPPYGRQLLERRRAGDHPPRALVLWVEAWPREVPEAALVMPAEEFAPGVFDWRPVAGLPVRVECMGDWCAPGLASLVAELLQAAAPVVVAGQAEPDLFTSRSGRWWEDGEDFLWLLRVQPPAGDYRERCRRWWRWRARGAIAA